jgi:hypothetical protein
MSKRKREPVVDETLIAQTVIEHDTFSVYNRDDFIYLAVTPGEIRRLAYWPKSELDTLIAALQSVRNA